ncbi:MAG TPA: O-methyltransferase, partial [Bacteroidales bacterium]|nr:O-methyltransferase [Bacteroidales bacterium]
EHISPEDPLLEDLYRQTHIRFVNPNMASGHSQGKFLEMISKMISPGYILEIGTFTGYSAICLAKGLRKEGKLLTIEINDELSDFSGGYFKKSGMESSIEQLTGNALDIIPDLNYIFDLVFIDGDKREYTAYFKAVYGKVKPGGFIIADNVLWGGKVLEPETADPQTSGMIEFNNMIKSNGSLEKMILPLRDGLTIIQKPE